jgi:hypothetical protein
MFTNPISVMFLQFPTKLFSSNNESNEMTDPTKTISTLQPRPRLCHKVHIFFLIHTSNGWIQVHMFTNPISVSFWPLHTIIFTSTKHVESNVITHPTKSGGTATKTQTMLQTSYVLSNTYAYRTDSFSYVYETHISRVFEITY